VGPGGLCAACLWILWETSSLTALARFGAQAMSWPMTVSHVRVALAQAHLTVSRHLKLRWESQPTKCGRKTEELCYYA
jgi:hypothetical protein